MTREELKTATNDELIDELNYCGYDSYYRDYRDDVVAEIKKRMQEPVLDKIKADIESMRFVYDRSPYYEDNRTDEEKAVDWFNMDKLLFLQIIDEYKAGE